MTEPAKTLLEASFNPKIKSYLLWYGVLMCVVMIFTIPFIPLWLIFASYFVNKYFERLHCELTTRSLKFNKGYIFRTEKTIPLDKIQDLTFKEGPLLKAFGLSILQIETAGSSASASADLSLIGIVNASQFRDKVLDQRDVVTENTSSSSAPSSDNSEDVLEVLKDIRNSLNRIEQSRNN
ncbi:MAG: PH domain-containing protein [Balneola sp.]|jgi:membrane protein YdbS with pleckstrin-like domain|tara:strand:+ start:217311 stop:217850 length:540 start_codon:yes stop_codon:yes gene_type:complete